MMPTNQTGEGRLVAPLPPPLSKRVRLNKTEQMAVSTIAGMLEPVLNQPLVSMKNEFQKGGKIQFSPKVLWGGVTANSLGLGVVTGVQGVTNEVAKDWLSNNNHESLTIADKFAAAGVAGGVSALVSCPSERVMDEHRERAKLKNLVKPTYMKTVSELVKKGGVAELFTGLGSTILRDGPFVMTYAVGTPLVAKEIKPYVRDSELAATVLGGVGVGLVGAAVTHPFDTLKTWRQAKMSPDWSVSALYKGFAPRATRVAVAVPFLAGATEGFKALWEEQKAK